MTRIPAFSLIIFFVFTIAKGQNLEGLSGLLRIPTAEMQTDKQISIGVNFIPKEYVSFSAFRNNGYSPYITLNFLPFVEVSLRITRLLNYNGEHEAIGDRTPSLRIRFIEEGENNPAVAVGLHDLISVYGGNEANHNNALYTVTSKHFNFDGIGTNIGIHLGYGVDWLKAANHSFVGLFGGLDFKFFNILELISEYDGTHSNGGIRIKLFDHISLLGGFLRWKYFSGGAGVSFGM